MKTPRALIAIAFGMASFGICADQDKSVPLDLEKITIKIIRIHVPEFPDNSDAFTIRMVCLDGQAYLLPLTLKGVAGISASFKDGKPQLCTFRPDGSAILMK